MQIYVKIIVHANLGSHNALKLLFFKYIKGSSKDCFCVCVCVCVCVDSTYNLIFLLQSTMIIMIIHCSVHIMNLNHWFCILCFYSV